MKNYEICVIQISGTWEEVDLTFNKQIKHH